METKRAIEILEKHQAWRRDIDDELGTEMQSPIELGKAIDFAIGALANYKEMTKALQGFVKDFESDYVMLDGTIVDNPPNILVVNYKIAIKAIEKAL
jgi:hypothetical protein